MLGLGDPSTQQGYVCAPKRVVFRRFQLGLSFCGVFLGERFVFVTAVSCCRRTRTVVALLVWCIAIFRSPAHAFVWSSVIARNTSKYRVGN